MKPASLGFVTPGMRVEYRVSADTVAWLPFAALAGTVVGSCVWGVLADIYGRRASIVLSSVMFVGTSICGAMPNFWWNVAMCFMMGAAAGGLLPVAYALLAEIMPTRHRGWSLVLVGGIGALGGVFAASSLSALLQPLFGWRIMWFLNLPTGLILVALSPLLPESARFLQQTGRTDQARAALARFGVTLTAGASSVAPPEPESHAPLPPVTHGFLGITTALTLAAMAWGLVNFGLLLWLPAALVAEGRSVGASSALIAKSTLIAAPTIVICAWLFSVWSTKWSLVAMTGVMVLGMLGLTVQELGAGGLSRPVIPLALLILGSTGVISMLLPYAAENYPLRIRGRGHRLGRRVQQARRTHGPGSERARRRAAVCGRHTGHRRARGRLHHSHRAVRARVPRTQPWRARCARRAAPGSVADLRRRRAVGLAQSTTDDWIAMPARSTLVIGVASAISRRRVFCSGVSGRVKDRRRSMCSVPDGLRDQRTPTVIFPSAQSFWAACLRSATAVHAPRLASSSSRGANPASLPPAASVSSAVRW